MYKLSKTPEGKTCSKLNRSLPTRPVAAILPDARSETRAFSIKMAADLQALLSTLACEPEAAVVKGPCSYYHYLCDGVDDRGWGCGYRSLQTMCSFAVAAKGVGPVTLAPDERVPSISKIQETLAKVGDKPSSFVGSKEWIGTVEAAMVMDELLSVQCRLLHLAPGGSPAHVETALHSHFRKNGAPVMIGGDVDNASKTLVGIVLGNSIQATKLLIADPHYIADNSDCGIIPIQWVDTRKIVNPNSFYNFCVPLVYTSVIGGMTA